MLFFDTILAWASFLCACAAILVGPWLFGAWEMWWFWPFTVCIFISTFFFAIRLIIRAVTRVPANGRAHPQDPRSPTAATALDIRQSAIGIHHSSFIIILTFLPFLIYAFVRLLQADVYMDAERSFLLFLTPFLIGIQIVFGFDKKKLQLLFMLILANLCLLGLYGIINHFVTGSRLVLWAEGYPQYIEDKRATGSYFCPDHFSGIMELGFCLCLGLLLTRRIAWRWKLFASLFAVIALLGVVLSKSRGGGLTIIVITASAFIWGFSQWPVYVRWYWRVSIGALCGVALIAFCHFESGYMNRFKSYFGWDELQRKPFNEMKTLIVQKVRVTSRGRMISGAIRAWRTKPFLGVGPGMHQNLWPHFAASPDGDREQGVWPTLPNNDFHSYEVHSDWVQLLEEYGAVGLVLFLVPASAVLFTLLKGLSLKQTEREKNKCQKIAWEYHAVILGGIFAYVCMAFHSLGDFNLQMPATVWLFAAILAIAVAYAVGDVKEPTPLSPPWRG